MMWEWGQCKSRRIGSCKEEGMLPSALDIDINPDSCV